MTSGLVLELSKAGFDIFYMDGNVLVRECDSEIPEVSKEVGHNCSKWAIELRSIFGGGHEVDGNCVHGGAFSLVENESVLLTLLDKVVLWCEEYL